MGENLMMELNLEVGSKSISEIIREISGIDDFAKKSWKLDFHVRALEEELRKIEAFKRELPNCMHLLKDAIGRLEEERLQFRGREMMEGLVVAKSDSEGDGRAKVSNDDELSEKKNWMSCVQLWSTPVQYENSFFTPNQDSALHLSSRYEEGQKGNGCDTQFRGCNLKNRGGAFVPFKKPSGVAVTTKEVNGTAPIGDGLTLSTPVGEVESPDLSVSGFGRARLQQPYQQEQHRKQRRCWSPELHKRFIDALHQLGGPKTATPKQIRELMKVDGLTNDEVKSHLQKYRIHIRKLPSSSSSSAGPYPGPSKYLWLGRGRGRGQCGDLSKPVAAAHSGSPEGPLHNGTSARGGSATGGDSINEEEDGHKL